MEFYYQEQLRWSFLFDNPNKTAALLATLLPVTWLAVSLSWRIRGRALRLLAILLSTAGLLAGSALLFGTLSRGGMVAAMIAAAYFILREVRRTGRPGKPVIIWGVLVFSVICALLVSTDAAERGIQSLVKEDKSVTNRWEVWKGGLQMAAESPLGVGHGNSGTAYMQWYQPHEATARYRTLVNSYLTFLTEHGYVSFATCLFLGASMWFCTQLARKKQTSPKHTLLQSVETALRACVIAFLVAAVWSTTMEELKLWIAPALALLGLIWIAITADRSRSLRASIVMAGATTASVTIMLYLTGIYLAAQAPVRIAVGRDGSVEITPKADPVASATMLIDEQVLGQDYGKLLRQLVVTSRMRLIVATEGFPNLGSSDLMIVAGETVHEMPAQSVNRLILIAPAEMEWQSALECAARASDILLILPSFDEDGRVAFWKRIAQEESDKTMQTPLAGVGTEVVWAWQSVVEAIATAANHQPRQTTTLLRTGNAAQPTLHPIHIDKGRSMLAPSEPTHYYVHDQSPQPEALAPPASSTTRDGEQNKENTK
jgi:hypothetical protein